MSLCRADTHLLGKTRVMPPSVAAKTAKRLYLQGEGPGMPAISGVLLCHHPHSPSQPSPIPICPKKVLPNLGHLPSTYVLRSWSFQTCSTSCCVIPVSRIRLCRRKLSPWELERRRR